MILKPLRYDYAPGDISNLFLQYIQIELDVLSFHLPSLSLFTGAEKNSVFLHYGLPKTTSANNSAQLRYLDPFFLRFDKRKMYSLETLQFYIA
ncbi:hypothetical protein AVEN_118333-1 [Araneus ventricosus]|uniref:Uncharacterized protein n=1 Tax=Araneus ventricosus TaxID=182803 RepID=A0A4Y2B7R5_ARAVE|nr:hypothetical protein AVEN_118333-1 [Araneus ventricosus]